MVQWQKVGWVSYEKVIVAVLACHSDGRCVGESDSGWRCKGAQVAVEQTIEEYRRAVEVTEAEVVYRQAARLQDRQSKGDKRRS